MKPLTKDKEKQIIIEDHRFKPSFIEKKGYLEEDIKSAVELVKLALCEGNECSDNGRCYNCSNIVSGFPALYPEEPTKECEYERFGKDVKEMGGNNGI